MISSGFRTKKDVERHVADALSRLNSENEKNLRGYTFARLFTQVKDYEAAKKHLSSFLSIRDNHAPAHRLMAQIFEATNNPESALQSYKRSLEIDPHQMDLVLKICELYCQLSVDHETARYWADRADQLYPHNEIVFKLRECLVSAEGEPDHQELENLIATELAAQPKNVGLRIRLLRLYLDTERLKDAYEHATLIESKRLFPFSVEWYYLLGDIFEAYQEEYGQNLDSQFYLNYLTALDRLVLLTLAEPHSFSCENGKKPYSVNDAAAVLLMFDQVLKKASEKDIKEGSWMYFTQYMKGQLYFYMASLLLKRAKMDQGNKKEAFKFSAGLAVVCYTFKPINLLQEVWFSNLEDNQKAFTNFFQQGSLRTSFIGHVITDMCKEDKSKWLQKLKLEVCISQVKERMYSRVFSSVVQKDKLLSSYFILDSTFENCSLEFPSELALQEYDKAAYKLCPDSLHHLVWLEMQRHSSNSSDLVDNLMEVYKGLQYSNKNLSKGSCESLCVLDLEAYLYATVYQAQCMVEKKKAYPSPKNQDSQLSFPPDIADAMCSKQQAAWWKAAYGLHTCTIKEKLGEHRRILQHGLEVIRGIGHHGMEVQLVAYLAQKFANKANSLMKETEANKEKYKIKPDNIKALQQRAIHYWNVALGMLEKMSSGQSLKIPKEQVFAGLNKPMSKDEIKNLQEDGQLYIAVCYIDSDKLNEAAEILSKLSNPYGPYYLALILQKMASQEEKFSSTKTVLLTKAKNSIHDTMDRIKDDKSHPLNKEMHIVLEDIENELATELSMNNSHSVDEDETDSYDVSPVYNSSLYMTPNSHKSAMHSTPRPQFVIPKSRIERNIDVSHKHFEPSPERLDAQIRALALNQDTVVKTVLEQQKTILEQQKSFLETNRTIADTLKQNTEVLEQLKKLIDELKVSDLRNQSKSSTRKASYPKGAAEEEDYGDYDPNNLLEFYTEESGEDYRNSAYGYNPSSRMVHEAAASLNYVMSPAIPPGPPPALNHYNYQYPPHAVLPAPPIAERAPFYHPPPGQGLPFSEGQQLPQFHFHVASSGVKPPPPVISSVGSIPQGMSLPPPPPPPSLHPPQPVIPPPSASLSMPSPWSKTTAGVPHNFQIPLPTSTPFSASSNVVPQMVPPTVSSSTPVTTQSTLKNLLMKTPPAPSLSSHSQHLTTPTTTATNLSIFTGISKTPETAAYEYSRCDSENAASPDADGDIEREVMGDFKPLIPLPAEIVVETGEEDEEVLFEDRAKLYRFVDQEWKERGLGIVKILHHNSSGRVRLLMRREQVLKVCANHYITPDMEIHPLKNSDRAWTWVAQDFADEELKPEHLCIRFKTAELAAAFKVAFVKAVNIAKDSGTKNSSSSKVTTDSLAISKPFGMKFAPKAGSWSCPTCYVSNGAEKNLCVACETKNPFAVPNTTTGTITVSSNFTTSTISKETLQDKPFTFNIGEVQSDHSSSQTPMTTSSSNAKSIFGGFTFSSFPTIRETESPEAKDREILVVSTKSKNGPQVTKVTPTSSPFSTFSFGKSPPVSSNVTVQLSGNTRTVTAIDETSSFGSVLSKPLFPVASSPNQSSTITSSFNENSLSKMQAMVQNINPTYTFESKDAYKNASQAPVELGKQPDLAFKPTVSPNVSKLTDNSPEEFVPTAEFKPVVPLPALVEIKTGEEKEEALFEERSKLFRYDSDSKEWKERGTGVLKILYSKDTKKYRILMRRDQVLKICANHNILPEMKLSQLPSSDKSWVWFAKDYSDGDLVEEKFAARFKNVEIAQKFRSVFEKCQQALESTFSENSSGIMNLATFEKEPNTSSNDKCAGNAAAFDQLIKPAANSWNCSNCHKANMNESSCVYCKTPKTNSMPKQENSNQKPLSEMFKPAAGSWECKNCYVRNKSTANTCASCETPKPNTFKLDHSTVQQDLVKSSSTVSSTTECHKPLGDMFKPKPGSWECQICLVRNDVDRAQCASCETPKSGSAAPSTAESTSVFGKFQFGSSDASAPTFQFGKEKSSEFVFGMRPVAQPTTFSFGHSTINNKENVTTGFKPALPASNSPAIFGGVTQTTLGEKNDSAKSTSTPMFGSFSSPSFTFGSNTTPQKSDSESVGFQFGSPQKYEFNFTGVRPRSPTKTPKSPRSPASPSDVDDEDGSDYEADNIYFQPAIPLPPKVDVVTGEEDENVLYCQRAKLFRFASGEWKERGIGDMKILFDDKTRKIRLLMRREQVLKVCLNHYLTKDLKFEKRGDKLWSWTATDFSENEPSPEILAVRFKTNELADEFKKAIDDALEKLDSSLNTSLDTVASKSASLFSFKSDFTTPSSVETHFNSGSLSSRFGTTQEKPVFGSNSFGFSNSKEATPFTFSFKDKTPVTSTFFSQPTSLNIEDSKTKESAPLSFGLTKETKGDDDDIIIDYEAVAPADKIAEAESLKLPKNFYLYENKPPCPGCIGCTDTIPPRKGSSAEEPKVVSTVTAEPSKPSAPSTESKTLFGSSKFASFSFADLASKASSESLAKPSPNKNIFAGAGAPVFSNLNTSAEDTDEVVQSADIQFEPVIPLPDLIEVKTGEEDEVPIFVHRAKLFRFDAVTKQWKERGVGDIKILSHKENIRFRIILRRDQVHNVACNHVIAKDMSLSPMATSENALCWNALDFSDGPDGEASQFAVRFKLKETLNQFKQVFDDCKEKLTNQVEGNTSVKETTTTLNSAASVDKENSANDTGVSKQVSESSVNVDNCSPEAVKHESESDSDKGSEEDEPELVFEKRATLEIYNEAEGAFKTAGVGCLSIIYDDTVYGYHIMMVDDKGKTMCDHIIAVQTCLRVEGKKAVWAVLDLSGESVTRKQFRATFSSLEALKEFSKCFEEGKEIALKTEIVEKAG